MARLISCATGNFLTAGTWGLTDATSQNDTSAEITAALTTSYQNSSGFTPGAITIDGLAIKPAVVTPAGATNTITVRLGNAGVDVAGTPTTMNVSDLPLCDTTDDNGGWVFFKFAAPVTLLAATAYTVGIKLSSTSTTVSCYVSATTNWSRMIRTTTTQAPAAGDDLFIMGENTGTGTGNNFTVTMDSITNTDYGSAATSVKTPGLSVSKRGTLTCGVVATTAYLIRLSGHFVNYSGGAFNWGTSGSPMPSDSSAWFEFDPASDGQFGAWAKSGSTTNIYGNTITNVKAFLAANLSAAGTTLTSDISTGWKNNDVIAIASTTRTATEAESKTLSGDASGTSITISAGATNAHSGTSPTRAELINLTRNVGFRSVTSTLMTFFIAQKLATITIRYAEFYYMGDDSTNLSNGVPNSFSGFGLLGTTGVQDVQYCSFHDFEDTGFIIGSSTSASVVFSNNVIYNIGTTTPTTNGGDLFDIGSTTTQGGITINANVFILMKANATNTGTNAGLRVLSGKVVFTNNSISSISTGSSKVMLVGDATAYFVPGNFDGNTIHSSTGTGAALTLYPGSGSANFGMYLSNTTIWRNNIPGIDFSSSNYFGREIYFDTLTMFANTTSNINISNAVTVGSLIIIRNGTLGADATFATTTGIVLGGGNLTKMLLVNCTLGSPTTHTTDISTVTGTTFQIDAINCTFSSGTEVSNVQTGQDASYFRSQKHDGSLDNTFSKYRRGTITAETSIRYTASGYAWKLAPTSTTIKLIYPGPGPFDTLKAAVNASSLVTITTRMVKNAAYNGNAARLVLVGGIVSGIASDVTASKAAAQKTITGATNATPIVVTSNSHGYSNGDRVLIEGVVGNTAANGTWTVANQAANTFELTGSVGNGAYSSGGTINLYELLTVTGTSSDAGVVEFYFDCDGTAGAIYVDDVSVSQ